MAAQRSASLLNTAPAAICPGVEPPGCGPARRAAVFCRGASLAAGSHSPAELHGGASLQQHAAWRDLRKRDDVMDVAGVGVGAGAGAGAGAGLMKLGRG
jgi:hypothetical protein